MSQRDFGRHKSLCVGVFFVSSESVNYHYGSGESLRTWSSLNFKFRKLQGTFCLYTEIFRRPFFCKTQYISIKMWITQPPKIVVSLLESLQIFHTNGTVVLGTVILQNNVAGCPWCLSSLRIEDREIMIVFQNCYCRDYWPFFYNVHHQNSSS